MCNYDKDEAGCECRMSKFSPNDWWTEGQNAMLHCIFVVLLYEIERVKASSVNA